MKSQRRGNSTSRRKGRKGRKQSRRKKTERESKLNTHKQFQSKDCIQCKGCPNQVKKTNMKKHLDKCQGLKFCDVCKEHILVRDLPSHKSCDKYPAMTTPATNLNPPQPPVPDLMNTCIQCKGCRNQVKKINFVRHQEKCEGFGFCRSCNQIVLVREHRSCGKHTPLDLSEPL